jgi:hypothetical protein
MQTHLEALGDLEDVCELVRSRVSDQAKVAILNRFMR